jgi:hypothetical protein
MITSSQHSILTILSVTALTSLCQCNESMKQAHHLPRHAWDVRWLMLSKRDSYLRLFTKKRRACHFCRLLVFQSYDNQWRWLAIAGIGAETDDTGPHRLKQPSFNAGETNAQKIKAPLLNLCVRFSRLYVLPASQELPDQVWATGRVNVNMFVPTKKQPSSKKEFLRSGEYFRLHETK